MRGGLLQRIPLLAAALAALVYLPSLGGGFLYDDVMTVVENRGIRDPTALSTVLRSDPSRPLLALSFALSHALGGLTPWGYHLVNVALHAGNAALVASLLVWMGERRRPQPLPQPRRAALIGACFFAVSPMAAETVAYVSSRSTALATLFGLASLRLGADALERRSWRRTVAALGLLLLGLATKEEALAVPLLLVLIDRFFLGPGLARRAPLLAPFLALPALGLLVRRGLTGEWLPAPAIPLERYLATQLAAFPGYLARALVPLDPALYRGVPPASWPPGAATLAWGALAVALLAAAVALRRRFPSWALAVLWMAAALAPSSTLVPLREMVVDHRAYLGGVGVAFALGGALAAPRLRGLAIAALAICAAVAWRYQWVLAEPVRAWSDAVARAPASAEARRALGDALAARDDPAAEVAYKQAVQLDPDDFRSHSALGALYLEAGRLREAAESMRAAVAAAPGDARAHDNYGMVLQRLGRYGEALRQYEAAVRGEPKLAQPRINLAALLIETGQVQRARRLLDEAAALEVDEYEAQAIRALRARIR